VPLLASAGDVPPSFTQAHRTGSGENIPPSSESCRVVALTENLTFDPGGPWPPTDIAGVQGLARQVRSECGWESERSYRFGKRDAEVGRGEGTERLRHRQNRHSGHTQHARIPRQPQGSAVVEPAQAIGPRDADALRRASGGRAISLLPQPRGAEDPGRQAHRLDRLRHHRRISGKTARPERSRQLRR
jgi:hypothetical protein